MLLLERHSFMNSHEEQQVLLIHNAVAFPAGQEHFGSAFDFDESVCI